MLWASAKQRCVADEGDVATAWGSAPHLNGAYPTTQRLALNWPQKVYPLTTAPSSTTTIPGEPAAPANTTGWPRGFDSAASTVICIYTGHFHHRVYGAGSSMVQHGKVLVEYLYPPKFLGISDWPMNSIPSRPVPVAG